MSLSTLTLNYAGTVLADGASRKLVGPFAASLQNTLQDATPIGSAVEVWLGRLKRSKRQSFPVLWQNTRLSRMLHQQLIEMDDLPKVGTLVLTLTEDGVVHTYTCLRAAVPGIADRQEGGTAHGITYEFYTPRWTYAYTAAEDYAGEDVDGSEDTNTLTLDGGSFLDVVMLPAVSGGVEA